VAATGLEIERKLGFFLWDRVVESRVHLIFLDALCRIAPFSEVLLFCAVAHHSQMDNGPGLSGVFLYVLRLRFVGHRKSLVLPVSGSRSQRSEIIQHEAPKSVRVGIYSSHYQQGWDDPHLR
jgi:hypothetical protein